MYFYLLMIECMITDFHTPLEGSHRVTTLGTIEDTKAFKSVIVLLYKLSDNDEGHDPSITRSS